MVVPESQDKMYYPSAELQRDAHVPDFNSYLELYRKSLENPEGRSNASGDSVQCLQCFLAFHHASVNNITVYLSCLEPATLTRSVVLFQLSGKRLLMSSFGRSQRQVQCCSTTSTWPKGTYMSNAWKGPKPTCAIMSSTDMWRRGTSVKGLPITGKQGRVPGINDGFDGKCCRELCQVFQSITTAVSPAVTPVHPNKPQSWCCSLSVGCQEQKRAFYMIRNFPRFNILDATNFLKSKITADCEACKTHKANIEQSLFLFKSRE